MYMPPYAYVICIVIFISSAEFYPMHYCLILIDIFYSSRKNTKYVGTAALKISFLIK